jgi:hypothetical protein
MSREERRQARAELMLLRARYDSGAMSIAIFVVIKAIETDIAWSEHRERMS